MKKFLILLCMMLSFSAFAVEQGNEIDPELLELVDNLNNEDVTAEGKIIDSLYEELFSIVDVSSKGVDFGVYKDKLIPYDNNFVNMKLSDQQRVMKANAQVKDEMTDKLVDLYKKDVRAFQKVLEIERNINFHENKLFSIMVKIARSSNENTMLAVDLLTETQSLLDSANTKLNLAESNARLLNEALAFQERKNKNAYILGNVIIPTIGIPLIFTSAMLVANSNDDSLVSPDFANTMLYSSIALTLGCELVWNGGHLIFKWW